MQNIIESRPGVTVRPMKASTTKQERTMYYVNLSHAKNPDISEGYWEQPVDVGKTKTVKCKTLQEAAQKCRAYIERNGLGGGNWTGGAVFFGSDRGCVPGMEQVATISYNGRIWDMTGKEIL